MSSERCRRSHTVPPPYARVGKCIYCDAETYSARVALRRLGDEHIIALGMDGDDNPLPEASCEECERITSGLEDHCVRYLLKHARTHLAVRGRKSRRAPKGGLFDSPHGSAPLKVERTNHPGYMIDFSYPLPGLLLGVSQTDGLGAALIHMRPVPENFEHRVRALGGSIRIKLGEDASIPIFARVLAKIAHAYCVAEIGLGNFTPLLPDIILGRPSAHTITDLVGTGASEEAPGNNRHEISFSSTLGSGRLIVVRVRLFANISRPTRAHLVVAGFPS
jgi:hypothetical protein